MNAQPVPSELGRDHFRVWAGTFAYRDHRDLLPVEPQREVPGVVLDQTADKTLEAAKEHAVDHDRALALALLVHERDVEPLGQVEVDLDRRSLPLASDRIFHLDVDLRRVEN